MLIDTHSHLYDSAFESDRDQAIARAQAAGVQAILLPAISTSTHDAMFNLTRSYPDYCFAMMGLHPTEVNDNAHFRQELNRVAELLDSPPTGITFCAVGEIGLDLYWSRDFLAEQLEALRFQLNLALSHKLPVALHVRDAWDECCAVLEEYRGQGLRGVLHSFSGTIAHFQRIKACGTFYAGIGGPLTYKKSTLPDVLTQMELSDILLETDSPYLPPTPYRGQRNESAYMVEVADRVAAIKGCSREEVERITTNNAQFLFDRIQIR